MTLFDPHPAVIGDLSTQFYLTESDIGQPRDQVTRSKLAELNNYVPIYVASDLKSLEQYKVIVLTESTIEEELEINEQARKYGNAFISAKVRGLFASAFCDFGKDFVCVDPTGEEPVRGSIGSISPNGVVLGLGGNRHGLEDGDVVKFRDVQGMESLSSAGSFKIKVNGPFSFEIGDVSHFGEYVNAGEFEQVKQPKILNFKSLKEQIASPDFLITDFAKVDRSIQLHIAFQALDKFISKHDRYPKALNVSDRSIFLDLCKQFDYKVELDIDLLTSFCDQSGGSTSPMMAVIGGFVAQEVLKACSGKFHPLFQFLYFDSLESFPKSDEQVESDYEPIGSRYDDQIKLFGKKFQDHLQNLKCFLVGAGAIGCEMLKNWGLMGVGSGPNGYIKVVDMDTIEKSNLNRQFLFRPWDVTKLKSETAANAIMKMNPHLEGKIISFSDRVGPDTEHLYNDKFFEDLDFVANALDNVEARTYMDRRCVYYRKPLLESGTLGTKGNTQVVVPHLTESYSSSQDPPEKAIPICVLHSFPNKIDHTIQWALDLFKGTFTLQPENALQYLENANYLENTVKQENSNLKKDVYEGLINVLKSERPTSFEECIVWARGKFEEYFSNAPKQLLHNFPLDFVASSGGLFWSGHKRAPTPLVFDPNNEAHMAFIVSAANLRAYVYGIEGSRQAESFLPVLEQVVVPDFVPRDGVKIQIDENENPSVENADESQLRKLIDQIPSRESLAGLKLFPVNFEKDDPLNFHIDFITAASNLRAENYSIEPSDHHTTKQIAGKIIPAIATTTSLVTGLVNLELFKIVDGRTSIEEFKNGFVNLALPFFGFSEPIQAPKAKYYDVEWTLWDRFDIEQDLTLCEFINHFQDKHKLEVLMLSVGSSLLYTNFSSKEKIAERWNVKMSELVRIVSKKPIPEHVHFIVLEVLVNDTEGEEVEVPYIKMRIK